MGHSKDYSRKNKRIHMEKGASSHHQATQPIPESGTLVPIPANPQNCFPFDARMRLTSSMKEREAKLKNFKVLNPIYPDLGLLSNLGICEEVEKYFMENGFGFVFESEPPLVYEALVREFVYSFVPEWREVQRQKSEFYVPEKHVVEWKFRLGGVEYTYSRKDLLRAFGLANRKKYPYVPRIEVHEFWKLISGSGVNYVSSQSFTKIIDPIWKLVHRFLSSCVIMRSDEGRWVSRSDLELLCCLQKGLNFDILIPITKAMEEPILPTFRGKYIGGGPFVTMLAMDIGFSLDPQFAMPRKFLGEEEMIRRGFLKLERTRQGTHRRLVGRDVFPKRKPTSPPPSSQYEFGSSSSAPPKPVTLEDISTQLRDLTTYTHDGFMWAGNVFTDLYSRMGYEETPPPPPYPNYPWYSGSGQGPQVQNDEEEEEEEEEDNEEEDDEEEDDEDDEEDEMDEDSDATL